MAKRFCFDGKTIGYLLVATLLVMFIFRKDVQGLVQPSTQCSQTN